IMGHKYPDMDAMGSAVGIYDICKACNKQANIVLDNSNDSIDEFVKRLKDNEYYSEIFISKDDAIKNCTKDTLVVVVDTHRPSFTECPELTMISDKVVVIDHHRRGVEFINDTVLLFHETYVSSTCEMVTELVQYMEDDVKINKLTAEGLMAGICLDTKNFAFKTGVRTFEAASYLKKKGADTIEVKKLFNSTLIDFVTKAEIIQSAKVIDEKICLAYSKAEVSNINIIVAQAADELLNIKNVEASFVLGKTKSGTIFVSARSLGSINVHVLMEKLGGGGHIDIAGAQIEDTSLEEGYNKVLDIINKYLEEEAE
ncbi:MAG: DHH family phosphoesterase, partial [Peptostreptococcaceae bacterium]|nr:DHH family phosphoesterase [Peptostreptococcaceae bacterium]